MAILPYLWIIGYIYNNKYSCILFSTSRSTRLVKLVFLNINIAFIDILYCNYIIKSLTQFIIIYIDFVTFFSKLYLFVCICQMLKIKFTLMEKLKKQTHHLVLTRKSLSDKLFRTIYIFLLTCVKFSETRTSLLNN